MPREKITNIDRYEVSRDEATGDVIIKLADVFEQGDTYQLSKESAIKMAYALLWAARKEQPLR